MTGLVLAAVLAASAPSSRQDRQRRPAQRSLLRRQRGARLTLPKRLAGSSLLEKCELRLHAMNLLDARYTSFGYVDGEALFIPAAGRNFYAGLVVGF